MRQITESTHILVQSWLKDGWKVARPDTVEEVQELLKQGYEASAALYNVYYKKPKEVIQPAPRYDEVFEKGTKWLDTL